MSQLWQIKCTDPSAFGNIAILAFLIVQALDGGLTYLGVRLGVAHEANPLLDWMMRSLGQGPALAGAKMLAGSCGIALHLTAGHRAVAALTGLYLAAAIVPWAALLFF